MENSEEVEKGSQTFDLQALRLPFSRATSSPHVPDNETLWLGDFPPIRLSQS